MSRLNNYLTETFNTNVNIKQTTSDKGEEYNYEFILTNGNKYILDIFTPGLFKDNSWEIIFSTLDEKEDITGTGNAYEVFSGVLKCIKDFIKKEKPDKDTPILFSAKTTEPSRIKLYNKLIKTKAKDFGYKLTKSFKGNNKNLYYELEKI